MQIAGAALLENPARILEFDYTSTTTVRLEKEKEKCFYKIFIIISNLEFNVSEGDKSLKVQCFKPLVKNLAK